MNTIYLKGHPKLKVAHEFVTKYPDAIIAGGVARDILLGREYNDIDIFVPELLTASASENLHGDIRSMEDCIVHNDTYTGYGARYIVGDLDICILPREDMTSIKRLVEQFDMVPSQAWLEPTHDGFNVKATELFHQMNARKVLGYYPGLVKQPSDHLSRIMRTFSSDYLLVALTESNDYLVNEGIKDYLISDGPIRY